MTTKNILITRKIPEVGVSMLREAGYAVDVNEQEGAVSAEQLLELLGQKEYDGVVTLLTDKITAKVFDATPSVKIFANFATGFDNIDVTEAKTRGVTVTNAPAELTGEAVAQHTLALMLALSNKVVQADNFVREGKYEGWDPMLFIGTRLAGKTVGIVGGGRIGEAVGKLCKNLGMQVVYTDMKPNKNLEDFCSAVYCESLEKLLPVADFVSLHVPLLPSTKHLINAEKIRLMKPTSFLINTARGPVVDEEALVTALQEKIIAGAGLDVFEFEPKISDGLLALPNVVLTPHISSASMEVREAMAKMVAENVIDFMNGNTPKNIVNK